MKPEGSRISVKSSHLAFPLPAGFSVTYDGIPIPKSQRRKDNMRLYMSTEPGGFRTLKVYRSLDGRQLRNHPKQWQGHRADRKSAVEKSC